MKLTFWGGLLGHLPSGRVLSHRYPYSRYSLIDIWHFASSISCMTRILDRKFFVFPFMVYGNIGSYPSNYLVIYTTINKINIGPCIAPLKLWQCIKEKPVKCLTVFEHSTLVSAVGNCFSWKLFQLEGERFECCLWSE